MARICIASIAVLCLAACGGKQPEQSATPSRPFLHSDELNAIMKGEVNEPFSALIFLVFHAEGDLDYSKIVVPASTLRAGIMKVRSIADPPVKTNEARAVFFTYVESLEHDAEAFGTALSRRDRARMESLLTKIGQTCNNCHHFFRLKITDSPEK